MSSGPEAKNVNNFLSRNLIARSLLILAKPSEYADQSSNCFLNVAREFFLEIHFFFTLLGLFPFLFFHSTGKMMFNHHLCPFNNDFLYPIDTVHRNRQNVRLSCKAGVHKSFTQSRCSASDCISRCFSIFVTVLVGNPVHRIPLIKP